MKNAMKLLSVALLVAGATQIFAAERAWTLASGDRKAFAQQLMDRTNRDLTPTDITNDTLRAAGMVPVIGMSRLIIIREAFAEGLVAGAKFTGLTGHTKALINHFNNLLLNSNFSEALKLTQDYREHPEYYVPWKGFSIDGRVTVQQVTDFLGRYIDKKSTEFFNDLLLDKKFNLAKNFVQAYAVRDAALSADWLRIVTAAKEGDDRVRDATAARLIEADEDKRYLAKLDIDISTMKAALAQAEKAKAKLEEKNAEMIRIRKDDAERLAARADDLKRSKPPVFKAK